MAAEDWLLKCCSTWIPRITTLQHSDLSNNWSHVLNDLCTLITWLYSAQQVISMHSHALRQQNDATHTHTHTHAYIYIYIYIHTHKQSNNYIVLISKRPHRSSTRHWLWLSTEACRLDVHLCTRISVYLARISWPYTWWRHRQQHTYFTS